MQVLMALKSHRPGALGQRPWPFCSLAMAHSPANCEASFVEITSFSGGLCLAFYWAY